MSAAVFAVLAISPPVGHIPRADYRLEALGDPALGRPWLLRARAVAGEAMGSPPRVSIEGAGVEAIAVLRDQGAWMRTHVPSGRDAVVLRLGDATGSHRVRVPIGPPRAVAAPPQFRERLHVVEGTLLPELTSDVIVEPGAHSARLVPVTEEVAVEPPLGTADACGLVRFAVRVTGLGAPASLVIPRPGGDERHELRLPLVPGGVAVRDEGDAVVLRATIPGATAHVVAGDALGPTWWSAAALASDGDEGRARVALPGGATWVIASREPDLSEPVSPLVRPPGGACRASPLGERLARGRSVPPVLPPLRVLWDGPAEARVLTGSRVHRSRALCAMGLVVSVALEAALLLGAGLARGPTALRPLGRSARDRMGVLVAGVSLLLLAGAAMGLSALLRGP